MQLRGSYGRRMDHAGIIGTPEWTGYLEKRVGTIQIDQHSFKAGVVTVQVACRQKSWHEAESCPAAYPLVLRVWPQHDTGKVNLWNEKHGVSRQYTPNE